MLHRTSTLLVLVLLVAAGCGAAGYLVGRSALAPSSGAGGSENSTLSILGAGTLSAEFPELARLMVNETPGVSAPLAAQTYEGSLDVLSAIVSTHARADVAAVADLREIPQVLEPGSATYEIVFGATAEVLCYDPSDAAFSGINTTNWGWRLVEALGQPGVAPFAVWNASTDPNGYNELFSMELEGEAENASATAIAGHLYHGAPTSLVTPDPSVTRLEKESQAAALLRAGTVSSLITYRSYAVANHLSFVPFTPLVGLAANDSASLADYAGLRTTILDASGGTTSVTAAPILFAATVPTEAPNGSLGAAFLDLLLSPQGSAILSAGGFVPIAPAWIDHPAAAPSLLRPDLVPLPEWASAIVG